MQEQVTLECTEAKKEGKPASRYLTFRNKKTVTERIEKKKYNYSSGTRCTAKSSNGREAAYGSFPCIKPGALPGFLLF